MQQTQKTQKEKAFLAKSKRGGFNKATIDRTALENKH